MSTRLRRRALAVVVCLACAAFAMIVMSCNGLIGGGGGHDRTTTAVAPGTVSMDAGGDDGSGSGTSADAGDDGDAARCSDATSDVFGALDFGFGDLGEVCIEPSLGGVCTEDNQVALGECTVSQCACAAAAAGTGTGTGTGTGGSDGGVDDSGGHTCQKKPIDGPFNCPADKMVYNCGPKGCCTKCRGDQSENPDHFDCDDFALVCQHWGLANGYNVCQLSFQGTDLDPKQKTCEKCKKKYGGGATWGHVINIAEFTAGNCANAEGDVSNGCFCMVEPQSNSQKCCWPNTGSITDNPPQACWDKLCTAWKSKDCKKTKLWCTATHSPGAGEKPFYVHEAVCRALGKCGYEWKKLDGCKACQAENPDNECKAKATNAECTACCISKHGSGTDGWRTCVRYAGCSSKP